MELNFNSVDDVNSELIGDDLIKAQDFITTFATDEDFNSRMKVAFGDTFDSENLEILRQEWVAGNFEELPKVEIRSADEINGANGAFSQDTNTIYLSYEFVTHNASNSQAINDVLLEEIGHYIDSRIGLTDAPGDEGAIFSALVRGENLDEQQLEFLRKKDDSATINLEGKQIFIEQDGTYQGSNIGSAIQGLSNSLATLQQNIDQQVYATSLPLLGTNLSTTNGAKFIDDIRTKLQTAGNALTPDGIQQALVDALGTNGLGILQNIEKVETPDDVKFKLKLSKTGNSFDSSLATDIGLPALKLNVNGKAKVDLGYDFDLNFGINKDNGFYFDTSSADELKISLNASDLNAKGKLGLLELNATGKGSQFNGTFAVDLKDSNQVDAKFTGNADVNLNLDAKFGNSEVLPSISSDFNLKWSFDNTIANPGQTQNFGNLSSVAFNNVSLELGSFGKFAGEILKPIDQITKPIQPIAKILDTDIDLKVGKFKLRDIAQKFSDTFGQDDIAFLDDVAKIGELSESVKSLKDGKINLGSFNLVSKDIRDPNLKLSKDDIDPTADIEQNSAASSFVNKVKEFPGLEFPILTDQTAAFNLLLDIYQQEPTTLFTYDMPDLSFKADYSQFFPIIGPLGAEIKGEVGATADLKFGFDTQGLVEFLNGNSTNPLNGFYVSDRANANGTGDDVSEVTLNADLTAFAALNVAVASGGVGGGIFGNVNFNLNDANNDGKVRYDEFSRLLNNPSCLFDTSGELTAGLRAYVTAGYGWFSYTENFDSPRVTLLNFNLPGDCSTQVKGTPVLASPINGELRLNSGSNAVAIVYSNEEEFGYSPSVGVLPVQNANTNYTNLIPSVTNQDEIFTVKKSSNTLINTLIVSRDTFSQQAPEKAGLPVVQQEFYALSKIVADGGDGNDIFNLESGILTPAQIKGGSGDDLIVSSSGDDTLEGDDGNDRIGGGVGNDTISGGKGDDLLEGESGADIIDGGEGSDTASYLTFQIFSDPSIGGPGVYADLSTGVARRLEDLIDRQADGLTSIENLIGSNYTDTLVGDSTNNILNGGKGTDVIYGGYGDDVIIGGADGDILEGGEGSDTISYITSKAGVSVNLATAATSGGDAQGDVFGSINVSGFNDIENIIGSNYDDTLIGDSGANRLTGGLGNDTLTGGAGADNFVFNFVSKFLSAGVDTITDFSVADDTMLVYAAGFGAGLTAGAAITAEQFSVSTTATDARQRFIYDNTSGALFFDTDGSDPTAQVQIATLSSGLALTNNDIAVV